jgi:hypothetical protein
MSMSIAEPAARRSVSAMQAGAGKTGKASANLVRQESGLNVAKRCQFFILAPSTKFFTKRNNPMPGQLP